MNHFTITNDTMIKQQYLSRFNSINSQNITELHQSGRQFNFPEMVLEEEPSFMLSPAKESFSFVQEIIVHQNGTDFVCEREANSKEEPSLNM